jgi:hypothetical protein
MKMQIQANAVIINANISELTFNATIRLNIRSGVIESLVINGAPEGFSIYLGEDVTIQSATINSQISFSGSGTIDKAQIYADSVTFDKEPDKMTVAPGISEPEIIPPSIGGGGGGGGAAPSEPLNIDASVVNSIITTSINEEYDLISNINVSTSNVNVTFTSDDEDETYITLINGKQTGKSQGVVNVTAKLSKSGYADKSITFKVAVAPVVLNWTNPSGNKYEGDTKIININGVSSMDGGTVVMLWEKKDGTEFKNINIDDITIRNKENEVIFNENGIYRIDEGLMVSGSTSISASATFNNSGEYKLTVYVIKE